MQITEGQKIGLGVLALIIIMGFVVWGVVKKVNELSQQQNIENRDFSNERYEILPSKIAKYIDFGVAKDHRMYQQVSNNSVYEHYERDLDDSIYERDLDDSIYERDLDDSIYENYEQTSKGENNKSIFCTCDSLINKDCESTVSRVNSYNSGFTEFSKFKDKGWVDVMPYDEFISKPNYENSNIGWKDEMPYQIYNGN
jgi:hypothetical protein